MRYIAEKKYFSNSFNMCYAFKHKTTMSSHSSAAVCQVSCQLQRAASYTDINSNVGGYPMAHS